MHRFVVDVGGEGLHVFSLRVGLWIPIYFLFVANIVLFPPLSVGDFHRYQKRTHLGGRSHTGRLHALNSLINQSSAVIWVR